MSWSLFKMFKKDRHHARIVRYAREAFIEKYGEKRLHRGANIRRVEKEYYILWLCCGNTRPPERSFWKVVLTGEAPSEAVELSYEEVKQYIQVPAWR